VSTCYAPLPEPTAITFLNALYVALLDDPLAPDLGTHGTCEGPVVAPGSARAQRTIALDLAFMGRRGSSVDHQRHGYRRRPGCYDHAGPSQSAMRSGSFTPFRASMTSVLGELERFVPNKISKRSSAGSRGAKRGGSRVATAAPSRRPGHGDVRPAGFGA